MKTKELSRSEVRDHEADRRVLDEHMEEFVAVGQALARIWARKSYKTVDGYDSFEAWCGGEYHMHKSTVYRLISASKLRLKLPSPKTSPERRPFWNEYAIREFGRLDHDSQAVAVAKKVVTEADQNPGAKALTLVRRFINEKLGVGTRTNNKRGKRREPPMFSEVIYDWTGELQGMTDILESVTDEDLQLFGQNEGRKAKNLVAAIVALQTSLQRVWESLP